MSSTSVGSAVDVPVITSAASVSEHVRLRVVVDGEAALTASDVRIGVESAPGAAVFVPRAAVAVSGNLAATSGSMALVEGDVVRVRVTPLTRQELTVRVEVVGVTSGVVHQAVEQELSVSSRFVYRGSIAHQTEIIAASVDGNTLITTSDGDNGVAFVDITDPTNPVRMPVVTEPRDAGLTLPGGDPTSVATTPDGRWLLVANRFLDVVDMETRAHVHSIEIPTGSDAVTVSGDGRFAAVAIEGAGDLVIVDLVAADQPDQWPVRIVEFDADDPAIEGTNLEPEHVAFSPDSTKIALTLQENNAVAIVDAATGAIDHLWNAGYVTRDDFDLRDDGWVSWTDSATLAREPDSIAWADNEHVFTADEGEARGSRGVSMFRIDGTLAWTTGVEFDELQQLEGQINDKRNDTQGAEFEGAAAATYSSGERFVFAAAERSDLMAVFDVADPTVQAVTQFVHLGFDNDNNPEEPEGVLPIPQRDLLAVSNEGAGRIRIFERLDSVPAPVELHDIRSQSIPFIGLGNPSNSGDGRYLATTGFGYDDWGPEPAAIYVLNPGYGETTLDAKVTISEPSGEALSVDLYGAVVDGAGGYWASTGDQRVIRTDADGTVTDSIDLPTRGRDDANLIGGMALSPDGATVYVATSERDNIYSSYVVYAIDSATSAVTRHVLEINDVLTSGNRNVVNVAALDDGRLLVQYADDYRDGTSVWLTDVAGAPDGAHVPAVYIGTYGGGFAGIESEAVGIGVDGDDLLIFSYATVGNFRVQRLAGELQFADTAPPEVALTVSPDLTVHARASLSSVDVTTNHVGTVAYELRPAGDEAAPWEPFGYLDVEPDVLVDGRSVTGPPVDGAYDLRATLTTPAGTVVTSPIVTDALTVTTPTDAIPQLSTSDRFAVPGGRFMVDAYIGANRGGSFELLAKPAGADPSEFAPLELVIRKPLSSQRGGNLIATAPVAPGDYDLRFDVVYGGHFAASSPVAEAVLHVAESPAATIELVGDLPFTAVADGVIQGAVAADQPGSVTIDYRDNTQTDPRWRYRTRIGVDGVAGTAFGFRLADPANGTWDLRFTHLNEYGKVSTTIVRAAAETFTGPPEILAMTPTAAEPQMYDQVTSELDITVTSSTNGNASVYLRPTGTETWTEYNDRWLEAGVTQEIPASLGSSHEPFGLWDIRIVAQNVLGDTTERVEIGAIEYVAAPPNVRNVLPPEGTQYVKPPGGYTRLDANVYPEAELVAEIKPAAAGEDAYELLRARDTTGGRFTFEHVQLPDEPGTYDLRFVVTGVDSQLATIVERPGAFVIEQPSVTDGVVISEFATHAYFHNSIDYVEIVNTGAAPVDLSAWSLVSCRSSSTPTLAVVPDGTNLQPGEYYLFGTTFYDAEAAKPVNQFGDPDAPPADQTINAVGSSDGFRLTDAAGATVDQVGSYAPYGCSEGEQAPPSGRQGVTPQRAPRPVDSGDNYSDFRERAYSPRGKGSFLPTVPGAPASVWAVPGNGAAEVHWSVPDTGDSALTGYVVTTYADGAVGASVEVDADDTMHVVDGLANGTVYTFTVAAVNAIGAGAESEHSDEVVPLGVPTAPTGVQATVDGDVVSVSWTAPDNAGGLGLTGYRVTAHAGGVAGEPIATDSTATTFDVTGLAKGVEYTFTVAASNGLGEGLASEPSNPVTIEVTPGDLPSAPSGVVGVAADGAVELEWTVPSDAGASAIVGYVVTPYVDGVAGAPVETGSDATEFVVDGLSNGTAYSFTVTAVNALGVGAESAPSDVVTPRTLPGAPTGVAGSSGDGEVAVSWIAPSDDGGSPVVGYVVTPFVDGVAGTPVETGSEATSFVVDGLTNGTAYTFTVAAMNAAGTGAESTASAAVTPQAVPGAPSGLAGEAGDRSVELTWSAPADDGGFPISGYVVTPYVNGVARTPLQVGPATGTVVDGLVNGTGYTFTVAAVNATGVGVESAATSQLTPATMPAAPTVVTAVAGDGAATVSWAAPDDGGSPITGYTVTPFTGVTALTAVHVDGDVTEARVDGLVNGTAYTFTVVATTAVGDSPASAPSAPVTPTAATADPVFVGVDPARLLDTREGQSTVDGLFAGIGQMAAGDVIALDVVGRGGIADDIAAVVVNVTADGAHGPGYFTVWDCSTPMPVASSVNFTTSVTVANSIGVELSGDGQICIYAGRAAVDVIVDVTGGFGAGDGFDGVVPARLLDTRPDEPTVDGQFSGIGRLTPGEAVEVQIAGRGGVAADAVAAMLNFAVTNPAGPGYLTVWDCNGPAPLASSINYAAGITIANSIAVELSESGSVCVIAGVSAVDVVVDATGSFAAGARFSGVTPARLLDTRPGERTIDGLVAGIGALEAGQTLQLQVAGRGGVPGAATSAVLNLTSTGAVGPGHLTVWDCDGPAPNASSLNYAGGDTIANSVMVELSESGAVCLRAGVSATHVVADVTGYVD